MFKRLLQALALCLGLFVIAPVSAPAANFGLAAGVPQALDAPATQIRYRHHYRRHGRRHRWHRYRHYRRWHHRHYRRGVDRQAERPPGRLRFEVERGGAGREPAPTPAPKTSTPRLY